MSQQESSTKQGQSGRRLAWTCLGAGVVLFVGGVVFGAGSWIYLKSKVYDRIDAMPLPTPRDLEAGMQQADVSAIAGLIIAFFGVMLIALALVGFSRRKVDLERGAEPLSDASGRWSDRAG